MHRIVLSLCCCIFSILCFGQSEFKISLQAKDYKIFFKDSTNREVTYGNYNPTGFVGYNDGAIIVSTEYSVHYPDRINDKETQVSSGSVFKLDSAFKKKWQIFIPEHRVMQIDKLPDQSVILAGDRTDMLKYWIAHIDTAGNILWKKEYKLKHNSSIIKMHTDSLGNIYLLISAVRQIPFMILSKKDLIEFRMGDMGRNVYLEKATPKGQILWTRMLENKIRNNQYGYDLFIGHNIFATIGYSGFLKQKSSFQKVGRHMLYVVNGRGKTISSSEISHKYYYHIKDSNFLCSDETDSMHFYVMNNFKLIQTDQFLFKEPVKNIWIRGSFESLNDIYLAGSDDYNLGYMLIRLNKFNKFTGFWQDNEMDPCELVDALIKPDGSIVILGTCINQDENFASPNISYINLKVLKTL